MRKVSPIDYGRKVLDQEIKRLELQNGLVPFDEWFDSVGDKKILSKGGIPRWKRSRRF